MSTYHVYYNKNYVLREIKKANELRKQYSNYQGCIIKIDGKPSGSVSLNELKSILVNYKAVYNLWFDSYYQKYWVELRSEDLIEK